MPSTLSHGSFSIGRALKDEQLVEVDNGADYEWRGARLEDSVEAMEKGAEKRRVGVLSCKDAQLVSNEDGEDAGDLVFLQEAEKMLRGWMRKTS